MDEAGYVRVWSVLAANPNPNPDPDPNPNPNPYPYPYPYPNPNRSILGEAAATYGLASGRSNIFWQQVQIKGRHMGDIGEIWGRSNIFW